MEYRSRLRNRVRNTLYKNTAISIAAIIVVLIFIIFFGLKLLVNFSLLLGRIKSIGEIPITSQNEFVLPPTLNPLPEATNSAVIEISGVGSQPGQTIELFLNGNSLKSALIDSDSRFTFAQIRLEIGENQIKARAKGNGNESDFTEEVILVYETTPPALEVTEPFDGQIVKKTGEIRVVGKTEPDATILVNEFLPIVDGNGNFYYRMPLLAGENTIKVTARDRAGNQTTNEIKVTFEP